MKKTFIIECTMEERWIDTFCSMLRKMENNGNLGHSEEVGIYSDGDGDFRPKFKGVYYNKKEKKWKALIKYNKKKYYLGNFENYEDAEKEILNKRKELGLPERREEDAKI